MPEEVSYQLHHRLQEKNLFHNRKVIGLYSSKHIEHAPKVEFLHGKLIRTVEIPVRIENIKQHLSGLEWVEIVEPPSVISLDDICTVHEKEMMTHLESLSATVDNIVGYEFSSVSLSNEDTEDLYYYPHTFPIRRGMENLQKNSESRHGYYCYDVTVPVGKNTWNTVVASANLAYTGARKVIEQNDAWVYAMCRPPGHHAGYDYMGGYCYINNAAVAAAEFSKQGLTAIIDIDYHHGNGTQSIFWDNPNVIYTSLHIHPEVDYPFYSGYEEERGGPNAEGTTINQPLMPGTTGEQYFEAFQRVLARILKLNPRYIVVSAGFDTFRGEPIGKFTLDEKTYYQIGQAIAELKIPTLLVQEGGYNAEYLGRLVQCFLEGVTS